MDPYDHHTGILSLIFKGINQYMIKPMKISRVDIQPQTTRLGACSMAGQLGLKLRPVFLNDLVE
jgi:hypothetical protein